MLDVIGVPGLRLDVWETTCLVAVEADRGSIESLCGVEDPTDWSATAAAAKVHNSRRISPVKWFHAMRKSGAIDSESKVS